MGQAKRRGTFEERKAQAMTRAEEQRQARAKVEGERLMAEAKRLAGLTEEQRERIMKGRANGPRKMMLAAMMATMLAQPQAKP